LERTVASLAVSALVASCSLVLLLSWEVIGEPRPARAQTTGTCPNAQLIDTFEGTGAQQTDTFDTTTNSLRVTYNVTGSDPDPASLFISVIDADDPDQLSVGNASQDGDGRGETFVNAPAGTYFLDITFLAFGDGGQYTITVEQCEGGNPSQNPRDDGPPVRDQYGPEKPLGPIDRPEGVIRRTTVRRVPPTGGPPYLAVGALVLLGVAVIAGRGALRR
jgi:hypothetical protein